jgi:glycosyltransferase involved in cell wall biosynthesis
VVVVRADPVICGHSGEARNLAEAALHRGFDDVRIVTWPLGAIAALPRKPLDAVLPYSPGITVERPEPVGDYKVPDGRFTAGLVGRLVELFCEPVPTVCVSLYLTPHASVVMDAMTVCRRMGIEPPVTTIAEAVGSDITNVVRSCVVGGRFGAAAQVFTTYLAHDRSVAVSRYTRDQIVAAAAEVDTGWGSTFAPQCDVRIGISYPAIDSRAADVDEIRMREVLGRRGLSPRGYVLFLSRLSDEKGADDLIAAFARTASSAFLRLVIAGNGPAEADLRRQADRSPVADRITFLADVDDAEKWSLMAGCAAFVLPSKPKPHFVETFGIALVEKMLAGGGPVITTATGGIPEAVGDTATIVPIESPSAIARAVDEAVFELSSRERRARAAAARAHALQFDRLRVFDRLVPAALLTC